MSTFVFAPGVKVYIDTFEHGILDVSEDLTRGGMQRRSDGVSQFQFGLNNPLRKYDNVFKPNDRLVVMMKRLTWMRTYTGYLNTVPLFSSWPREVSLTSSCSLKRLQYFYWDPNLAASQNLVRESLVLQSDGTAPDGGIKQVVINLLEEVVDWSGSKLAKDASLGGTKVHIGAIPPNWFDFAAQIAQSVVDNVGEEAALAQSLQIALGASATVSGAELGTNGTIGPGTYAGTDLDFEQTSNAGNVISTVFGREGFNSRDAEFAIGCCLQESTLRNLTGGDRDSVGLFQQRPSQGWGTVEECRNIPHATNKFLDNLGGIKNRYSMPFTAVIQMVQRSGFPNAYAKWEPVAKALVTEYVRTAGTKTTTNTLGSGLQTRSGVTGNDANTATTPVTHGTTTGLALIEVARQVTQRPIPYSQKLASNYDDPNPSHFDCSAFVRWVYYHALGTLNGMPRTSQEQYDWAIANGGKRISVATAFQNPGSLVFVSRGQSKIHHVEMVVAPNRTIGSHHTGTYAGEIDYSASSFDLAVALPGVHYPNGAVAQGVGDSSGVGVYLNTTGLTAERTDIVEDGSPVDSLFGSIAWTNTATNPEATGLAQGLVGIRALQNDEPILPYITNLLNATMRQYCSAPNGDFIAWFPDYYGLWGTAAKMVLQPIEVKDFQVSWSDEYLVTHQFVTPATDGGAIQLDLTSGDVSTQYLLSQMLSTGIATVDQPGIMSALFGLDQTSEQAARFTKFIYDRFGPRPDLTQVPGITGPKGEFFLALFLFMQSWTHQFSANIDITYMPELFPGMLIQLPAYNFQAYVVQVEHDFTMGAGGSFGTRINVAAPARIKDTGDGDKLLGLPIAEKARGKASAPPKIGTAPGRPAAPLHGSTHTDPDIFGGRR